MDSLVKIDQKDEGGVLVVSVGGRLDATSAPMLDKYMTTLIDDGHYKIVMNFEELDYLSSAGMRLLLSTTKRLTANNGKFVVANITENVMDVIQLAGFDRIFTIADSEDAALALFN